MLKSLIKTQSPEFQQNYGHHLKLAEDLAQRLRYNREGGGAKSQEYQKSLGKSSARERVSQLLDPDTHLLEIAPLAGDGLYEDQVPGAGLVTGIGQVEGRTCMIVANDATVKGGTYYPITVKKHLRAQEIALQNRLPCIYLVDSGGAFLPMQDEVFPDKDDFGRIFFNQARMSALGIPQLSSVHGFCTAGGAYIPAMSDQSIIVRGTGTIFLAGPPLVKAATGEDVTAEELGGAQVHTAKSGVADHLAENDLHAMEIMRDIVAHLRAPESCGITLSKPQEPAYDPDELLGVIPQDPKKFYDSREVITRLVDQSEFFEFKKNFATTLVTGFAHIQGIPVGIIANNGVLFSESALKATHFIEVCCQENIPLLFLQNITGFIVGRQYEHQGIAKDGAKMVHAVANARVPKITLVIGGSYGAGNYGMCGRAFDPSFLYMWPHAKIGVMGGEQAAQVLVTVKEQQLAKQGRSLSDSEIRDLRSPILAKYERESSCYYSSARLWDDGVIDPRHTRTLLARSLAATLHHTWTRTQFGVFRM